MRIAFVLLPFLAPLAACQQEAPAQPPEQRIALEAADNRQAFAIASPDTSLARWTVAENGQAIDFGNLDEEPMMTLAWDLQAEPAALAVIRHAQAFPDQTALFPVIGNGMISRFATDSTLVDGEWRWQAVLPADDPQLDIFEGTRSLTATLPGRGMLELAGSRIPGEFLAWCRSGGQTKEPESDEPEAERGPATGEDAGADDAA